MVIHRDPLFGEGGGEIGFLGDAAMGEAIAEDLLDGILLGQRNADAVRIHPACQAPQGILPAQIQHPAPILAGNQLPGGPQQMAPHDLSFIVFFFKRLGRRFPGPHPHRPAHHTVFLRLHRPHPLHHIMR